MRWVMRYILRKLEKKHFAPSLSKVFLGSSVLELVDNDDGDTYRAVYTTKFADIVFVLHAFQKKSTQGIATPKHHLDLIQERLHQAQHAYAQLIQELNS